MKKIIILLSFISLILTAFTFLNLRIEQVEEKISLVKTENIKLKHQLRFLRAEWEYISAPKNIEELSSKYFKLENIRLIDKDFLLKLLNFSEDG